MPLLQKRNLDSEMGTVLISIQPGGGRVEVRPQSCLTVKSVLFPYPSPFSCLTLACLPYSSPCSHLASRLCDIDSPPQR